MLENPNPNPNPDMASEPDAATSACPLQAASDASSATPHQSPHGTIPTGLEADIGAGGAGASGKRRSHVHVVYELRARVGPFECTS